MLGEGRWLLVSKPLRPPFRDGSTVMVRGLVEGLPPEFPVAYLGDPSHPLRPRDRVIDAPSMGYSPGLTDKARVLGAVLDPRHARSPLHFFFTPNRISSSVLASVQRVAPWRTIVQTVTSSDGVDEHASMLAGLDAVVVSSQGAARRLEAAKVEPERIFVIPPGVDVPAEVPARTEPARLLFAGDLDETVVARLVEIGRMLRRPELHPWTLVVATRPKEADQVRLRAQLHAALAPEIADERVEVHGEVEDMDALLRSTRAQLFLADHVRRKVDLPLVLLEGMARGVGLISMRGSTVDEIFEAGRRHGWRPGLHLEPAAPGILARQIAEFLSNLSKVDASGRDARRLTARVYSVQAMVDAYVSLYHSLRHSQSDPRRRWLRGPSRRRR